MKNLLSLIVVCLAPTIALADASIVPAKTQLLVPVPPNSEDYTTRAYTLREDHYLIDQADMNQLLLEKKEQALCRQSLAEKEATQCGGEESFLETIGWPGVIFGAVILSAVVATGASVFVFEASRPR